MSILANKSCCLCNESETMCLKFFPTTNRLEVFQKEKVLIKNQDKK